MEIKLTFVLTEMFQFLGDKDAIIRKVKVRRHLEGKIIIICCLLMLTWKIT